MKRGRTEAGEEGKSWGKIRKRERIILRREEEKILGRKRKGWERKGKILEEDGGEKREKEIEEERERGRGK